MISLGPCVATRDEQKLKNYVTDLAAGELVLIKPPLVTKDALVPKKEPAVTKP